MGILRSLGNRMRETRTCLFHCLDSRSPDMDAAPMKNQSDGEWRKHSVENPFSDP